MIHKQRSNIYEVAPHFSSPLVPNSAIVDPNVPSRDVETVCVECGQVYDIVIVLQD